MATRVKLPKAVEQEPEIPKSSALELDSAAIILLDTLPAKCQELLREVAAQQAIPEWMLIAGLVLRIFEMGEYTAPSLQPEWVYTTPVVRSAALPEQTCPVCNELFQPRWRGQLYDRSDCGAIAERTRLDRLRAERRNLRVPPPVGFEESSDVRSTIGAAGNNPELPAGVLADAHADFEAALTAVIPGTEDEQPATGGLGAVAGSEGTG